MLNNSDELPYSDAVPLIFQNDFISGETPFEEEQLEAAISGVIFETIEKEQTVCDAAFQVNSKNNQGFDLEPWKKRKLLNSCNRGNVV